MSQLVIKRAGPLTTLQDSGRTGMLVHGVSASGPMDRRGFALAEAMAETGCGAALEFTASGLCLVFKGPPCRMGFAGGGFIISVNGRALDWPGSTMLEHDDVVEISAGPWGNYGYVRFDHEIDVPLVMGSRATNVTVGLGGYAGRALAAGDCLDLTPLPTGEPVRSITTLHPTELAEPVRFIWGIHAELFPAAVRHAFTANPFRISPQMDRMGVRLIDAVNVFSSQRILSLVSDSVVPGDVQILGDGTPIVLLRDHQPTGGYPRIATVIDADCDRLAQIRSGQNIMFQSVNVESAQTASGKMR